MTKKRATSASCADPRESADVHINAVAATTEAKDRGWVDKAVSKLAAFAEKQSARFTVEQARIHIADKLPDPSDLRAWGKVTTEAIRRRVLKPTNDFAPARSSHGSPKRLYVFGGGQ